MSERTPAEDLAFRARALAQAHPLTGTATRFVNKVVGEQRLAQPLPEIGIWAGAGLTCGYCLRRVEEDAAGLALTSVEGSDPELAALGDRADHVAADIRTGAATHSLVDEDVVVAALDRIIASEIERRLDHWRDTIDAAAWAELEEYIAFWVVKGYALRVAEQSTGALA